MTELVPENIAQTILFLRGHKVMLDFHLAQLYELETRSLKQQVKRNLDRFPEDFMFELNSNEINDLVSQNVIPHTRVLGGAAPMAFTELCQPLHNSVYGNKKIM